VQEQSAQTGRPVPGALKCMMISIKKSCLILVAHGANVQLQALF